MRPSLLKVEETNLLTLFKSSWGVFLLVADRVGPEPAVSAVWPCLGTTPKLAR